MGRFGGGGIFDCICLLLNVQNSEVAEMVGAPDWEFPNFVLSWFHRYTNINTVTCASLGTLIRQTVPKSRDYYEIDLTLMLSPGALPPLLSSPPPFPYTLNVLLHSPKAID